MLRFDWTETVPGAPGVTVFHDNESVSTYYILPDQPRFRLDAQQNPVFYFMKYREALDREGGRKAGGFCNFDVEFVVAPATERVVVDFLQGRLNQQFPGGGAPQVRIAPIPWIRGTAKLLLSEGEHAPVKRVNSPNAPSLYGSNVCTFALELDPEMATIFEQALQGKGGFVGVAYDLFTWTKLPPIVVRGQFVAEKFYSFYQQVDIEWNTWGEDSYKETIREQFSDASSYTLDFDWGAVTDSKLQTQIRDWANQTMQDQIEKKMIEAIAPVSQDDRKVPDSIEDVTRDLSVHKIASFSLLYKENQVIEWNPKPQGILSNITTLVGGDGKPIKWSDYSSTVDLDDPFFRTLEVQISANADFEKLPIHSVEVLLRYQEGTTNVVKEFALRDPNTVARFRTFIENDKRKYKYRYTVNYKGASRALTSPEFEVDDTILTINVDDSGLLGIDVLPGDLNFAQVSAAQVAIQYEDPDNAVAPIEDQFTLSEASKSARFERLIFAPRTKQYRYRVKYFMKNGKEFTADWKNARAQKLYINDPFSATRTIGVRAIGDLKNDVETIFVDLKYVDETNAYSQTHSIALSQAQTFFDWAIPVIDEAAGKIVYSGSIQFKDGKVLEIPETVTTRNTIMVGRARDDADFLKVTVVPDLVDFAAVKLVKVGLHYSDPANDIDARQDLLLRPGDPAPQPWSVRLADKSKREFEWQATFFKTAGGSVTLGPVTTSDPTVVLEVPSAVRGAGQGS